MYVTCKELGAPVRPKAFMHIVTTPFLILGSRLSFPCPLHKVEAARILTGSLLLKRWLLHPFGLVPHQAGVVVSIYCCSFIKSQHIVRCLYTFSTYTAGADLGLLLSSMMPYSSKFLICSSSSATVQECDTVRL